MTRAEALKQIVRAPREVPDDDRIGYRVIEAKPDDAKVRIARRWQRRLEDWKLRNAS
jgi:hypothetical protein